MPPFGDGAAGVGRRAGRRLRRRLGRRLRGGVTIGVANDDDGVIEGRATVVFGCDDTGAVELEGVGASVESDGDRLLLHSQLDVLN